VRGEPSEFVVNQRNQFLGGFRVALLHAVENLRDFAHVSTLALSSLAGKRRVWMEQFGLYLLNA